MNDVIIEWMTLLREIFKFKNIEEVLMQISKVCFSFSKQRIEANNYQPTN